MNLVNVSQMSAGGIANVYILGRKEALVKPKAEYEDDEGT